MRVHHLISHTPGTVDMEAVGGEELKPTHGRIQPTKAPLSPAISDRSTSNDADAGKRLLQLGHDGLSDFTSQEFRMHEFLR